MGFEVNIIYFSERSCIALTVLEGEQIIGFASFLDYPQIKTVEPTNWTEEIHTYCTGDLYKVTCSNFGT